MTRVCPVQQMQSKPHDASAAFWNSTNLKNDAHMLCGVQRSPRVPSRLSELSPGGVEIDDVWQSTPHVAVAGAWIKSRVYLSLEVQAKSLAALQGVKNGRAVVHRT